jgi:transposase-like protein
MPPVSPASGQAARAGYRDNADRCGAAARLPENDRKELAVQVLARSKPVSDLAARHGVSRKFVYQQTHKARVALDDAFRSATPDNEVLFELAVTKGWLRQVIVRWR